MLRSDVLVSEATASPLVLLGSLSGIQGVVEEEAAEKNKMAMVLEKAAFGAEGLGFAKEGAGGSRMVVDKLAVGEVLECTSEVVGRILAAGVEDMVTGWE